MHSLKPTQSFFCHGQLLSGRQRKASHCCQLLVKVGDAVAEADPAPSEAQNYFAMLGETPGTLLPRLVAQWGCADSTAQRVAALLGADLVRPLLSGKLSCCQL